MAAESARRTFLSCVIPPLCWSISLVQFVWKFPRGFLSMFILGNPRTSGIPTTDPRWNTNDADQPTLEHDKNCILVGWRKGVPKQKSCNKLQQRPDENSSEFLDCIFEDYGRYTDVHPEAPESLKVMNMTYWAECPWYPKKASKGSGGLWHA